MAKYGISLKIDVSKIDKARLFKGQKGVYLDAQVFVDTDNLSEFGDNGMIAQAVSKDERQQGVKGAILGNAKIFYTGESEQKQGGFQPQQQAPQQGFQPQQQGVAHRHGQPQQESSPDPSADFDDQIQF